MKKFVVIIRQLMLKVITKVKDNSNPMIKVLFLGLDLKTQNQLLTI
jgi:hypothetical protein